MFNHLLLSTAILQDFPINPIVANITTEEQIQFRRNWRSLDGRIQHEIVRISASGEIGHRSQESVTTISLGAKIGPN
jgi:hypothetical protein